MVHARNQTSAKDAQRHSKLGSQSAYASVGGVEPRLLPPLFYK